MLDGNCRESHLSFLSIQSLGPGSTGQDRFDNQSNNDCNPQVLATGLSGINRNDFGGFLAGGRGFEPRLTGPEPVVLPLDDPPNQSMILALVGGYVNTI